MPLLALDTEVGGLDHFHGARVFFVTICNEQGDNTFWQWSVNPLTRQPIIPQEDVDAIVAVLTDPDNQFVLHNSAFDFAALHQVLPLPQEFWLALWDRTDDTLTAAHVLGSALPHGLDACAYQYLDGGKRTGNSIGKLMNDYENKVEAAVKTARDYARRHLPNWRLAKEGDPMMPSVSGGKESKNSQDKDKPWKSDMWLLKAILDHPKHPEDQRSKIEKWRKEWAGEYGEGLTADYANLDTAVDIKLWPVMKAELERRDLWLHYKERLKLPRLAFLMADNGLTLSEERLETTAGRYEEGVSEALDTCLKIADEMGYPLEMPKGSANNNSLKTFFFGEATVSCSHCKRKVVDEKDKPITDREWAARQKGLRGQCRFCKRHCEAIVRDWPWLDLPILKHTDSGQPSLDKDVMEQYLGGEELTDNQRTFLTALQDIRKGGKALEALRGYQSFWLPILGVSGFKVIHPSPNPTGTDTLRWSFKNPALQTISKGERYNNRIAFGPGPGREAWSFDYRNIEKRLPAYECGEQAFIDLFERADEPPFYGSDHILKFSAVYPHLWEKALKDHGAEHAAEWIKSPEGYKATWYQRIKNTNFALQYECGDAKADKTAHAVGVKKLLSGSFPREAAMKKHWIAYANRHGFVETMPDRTVNPRKGYPLMTQRSERGDVKPTIPLAYRVSGTAMWLTARAMVECQKQLDVWNRECGIPNNYRMALQVHDELFFDWPAAGDPKKNPRRSNLSRARIIQQIMEACGSDLICDRLDGQRVTIPTPVSVDYHPVSWDVGTAI